MPKLVFKKGNESLETFEPVPSSWYDSKVKEIKVNKTKDKGTRVDFTFEVIIGEYKGRKVFCGVNLNHPSEGAAEYAEKFLTSLCKALGINGFKKTEELLGKELCIFVKLKPAEGGYPAKNDVSGLKPLDDEEEDIDEDEEDEEPDDEEEPEEDDEEEDEEEEDEDDEEDEEEEEEEEPVVIRKKKKSKKKEAKKPAKKGKAKKKTKGLPDFLKS